VLPETGTPTVYLLGGTVALDQPVEDRLDELGYDTVRYGGLNRFDTAAIIADEGLDNPDTLLLANGGDFPDAVSAGAAAGNVDGAVLLTSGADMAPETAAYIEAHPVETRTAIGGSAAQADPDATAIVGANRVATAVMVAESFFPSPAVVGLATAGDFADGLTGGAMVGRLGGPILLTDGAALSAEVRTYLEDNTDSIMTAYIYGGVEALSQDVQDEVEDVLTP
jgi:putative cell wall-binding protein